MRHISDGAPAYIVGLRLLDCLSHGVVHGHRPWRQIGVDAGDRAGQRVHADVGPSVDLTGPQSLGVGRNPQHPVRVHAAEIGPDQNIRPDPGVTGFDPKMFEHLSDEFRQIGLRKLDSGIGHNGS